MPVDQCKSVAPPPTNPDGDERCYGEGVDLREVEGLFDCMFCSLRRTVSYRELSVFGRPVCPECGREMGLWSEDGRIREHHDQARELPQMMRDAATDWANLHLMEVAWDEVDTDTERAYGCLVCLLPLANAQVCDPPTWSITGKDADRMRSVLADQMDKLPTDMRRRVEQAAQVIEDMLEIELIQR